MTTTAPAAQPRQAVSASPNRFEELDGLRGLAAFSVFFSHVYLMQKVDRIPEYLSNSVVRTLWDGEAAVTLFFILSGFVLSLPYLGTSQRPIRLMPYLVRRVFRIYPAYLFALFASILLMHYAFASGGLNELSDWVRQCWREPVSLEQIIRHITLIGPDTSKIDPPVWTLRLELIISSLFPLLLYVMQGRNSRLLSAAIAVSFALFFVLRPTALFFFALFIVGGILAKYHLRLTAAFRQLPHLALSGLLALAFVLYSSKFSLGAVAAHDLLGKFTVPAGAALLIILAIAYRPWTKVLNTRPVQFLGDVSYSFYLLHFPILLSVSSFVHPLTGSLILTSTLALIVSLGVSHVIVRCIEKPFHNYGRKVSGLPALASLQDRLTSLLGPRSAG